MAVRLWILDSGIDRLNKHPSLSNLDFEEYGSSGEDYIVTAETENTGEFSHLSKDFVIGKVNFWNQKETGQKTPFARIDNHCAWPDGAIMSPADWINLKLNLKRKTIDQLTNLHRIQMLHAAKGDFVKRAFTTYHCAAIVPHPHEKEKNFLLYCDSQYLYEGRVR